MYADGRASVPRWPKLNILIVIVALKNIPLNVQYSYQTSSCFINITNTVYPNDSN